MVTITPEIRAFLMQPAPLIITKSDVMATVHRRAPMEYIGIKQFDTQGELTGELRIVGLLPRRPIPGAPRHPADPPQGRATVCGMLVRPVHSARLTGRAK